jgi:uncharacterized iron-regulated protein
MSLAGRTSRLGSTILWWAIGMSTPFGCRAPQPEPAIDREPIQQRSRDAGMPEVTGSLGASRAVEQAGAPFAGLRLRDGVWFSDQEVMDELGRRDIVCLGGAPDLAADYWAALQLLSSLGRRADYSGRSLRLGLEAFSTETQHVLDRYLVGDADERTLLREAKWQPAPYPDFGFYRPLLELARELTLPVLGLDADRELVAVVVDKGLDSLDKKQKWQLKNLDLSGAEAHAGTPGNRHLAAVIHEETMARTAAECVTSRQPADQLLLVARADLCRTSAVPARIARKAPSARVVTIRRVDRVDSTSPGSELEGFDYALVPESETPPSWAATPADTLALDSSVVHQRGPKRRAPSRRRR